MKNLALYKKLNSHQRILNRVFKFHQISLSWFSFKESLGGRNTNSSASCKKMKTVDELSHEMKKPCSLCKIEHSSADLQPCLQISSNSLCHGLVLKSDSVVEIQI